MRILGISGGVDFPHEDMFKPVLMQGEVHDAAAVLIENGQVIAAFEEERLNRVKHTGKFPYNAVRKCLEMNGLQLSDIDKIVYYCSETEAKFETINHRNIYSQFSYRNPKAMFVERLREFFQSDFNKDNIVFVNHHYCHAASAYYMSGFDRALIVTIDGASPEGLAGMVMSAEGDSLKVLNRISNNDSLGAFYTQVIEYLGYSTHDEYKVMGLAPYGDPEKLRKLFKKAIVLLPDGKFRINQGWKYVLMDSLIPRLKDGLITQEHKDVAAALQVTLEMVVMHILKHYQQATGHTKLCMAGGVAHNCSMNGKLLYANLFEEIFVQPAAHDAGNALGGALYVSRKIEPETDLKRLQHLYWGTDIQDNDGIHRILTQWNKFITFRKVENVVETAARLIAIGSVIGWVQGRAEFGPRALGNRSILADPRPAENKNIINSMVKKREGYRPFAPSVMEEYISEYYEIPDTLAPFSFMNFVLTTKPDKRSLLGAVTHVDGTARIQSVSSDTNEKYWSLINEFRKLTGVPILLNTSFNNNAEPIVDSEEDAIISFLTTNIHKLVIGDYVIEKKEINVSEYLSSVPRRLVNAELKKSIGYSADGHSQTVYEIRLHFAEKYRKKISGDMFRLLEQADGNKTLGELIDCSGCEQLTKEEIVAELIELWSSRLIALRPSEVTEPVI